ncbi:hypothetical protein M513_01270 [Trichuris suis]|uniref:Uncharacterized protein n=1 Tax=Trichuris suis TaxID=68888 RepID=A0A085MLE1_9BILA|nr:hypothetical protein M513_01270 [Trichuris suis]
MVASASVNAKRPTNPEIQGARDRISALGPPTDPVRATLEHPRPKGSWYVRGALKAIRDRWRVKG